MQPPWLNLFEILRHDNNPPSLKKSFKNCGSVYGHTDDIIDTNKKINKILIFIIRATCLRKDCMTTSFTRAENVWSIQHNLAQGSPKYPSVINGTIMHTCNEMQPPPSTLPDVLGSPNS